MSRSQWKGPYIAEQHLEVLAKSLKNSAEIKISRHTEILPKFIEKTFKIHNGKKYIELLVTEEMIGHKFGEFSATRKRFFFKKKKTKK